jgi:hypothetical protein
MDISLILTEGGLRIGEHYQIIGVYGVDSWPNVLKMVDATPYPQEASLAAWTVAAQAKLDAEVAFQAAQQGLKAKIALAKTYAVEIQTLWNVCLDQLETNSSQPARFNAVLAAVNALPTALKNRVNKGTPDPAQALNDVQRDAYVDHVLIVATTLACLLSQG